MRCGELFTEFESSLKRKLYYKNDRYIVRRRGRKLKTAGKSWYKITHFTLVYVIAINTIFCDFDIITTGL